MSPALAEQQPVDVLKRHFAQNSEQAEERYRELVRDSQAFIKRYGVVAVDDTLRAVNRSQDELLVEIQDGEKRRRKCERVAKLPAVRKSLETSAGELQTAKDALAKAIEPLQRKVEDRQRELDNLQDELCRLTSLRHELVDAAPEWLQSEIASVKRQISDRQKAMHAKPVAVHGEALWDSAGNRWVPPGHFRSKTVASPDATTKAEQKEFDEFMARVRAHGAQCEVDAAEIAKLRTKLVALEELASQPFPTKTELEAINASD